MTPAEIEALARAAARQALGRGPTPAEVIRVLAMWCTQLDASVSAGYLRRPPLRPARPPKSPPPSVS